MDPILILAGLVLLGITVYLIGQPFLRPAREFEGEYDLGLENFAEEDGRGTIFSTLAEIEFDYQMGKLTKEDYLRLKSEYQPKAVELLQSAKKDQARKGGAVKNRQAIEAELERELEKELALIRKEVKDNP